MEGARQPFGALLGRKPSKDTDLIEGVIRGKSMSRLNWTAV